MTAGNNRAGRDGYHRMELDSNHISRKVQNFKGGRVIDPLFSCKVIKTREAHYMVLIPIRHHLPPDIVRHMEIKFVTSATDFTALILKHEYKPRP